MVKKKNIWIDVSIIIVNYWSTVDKQNGCPSGSIITVEVSKYCVLAFLAPCLIASSTASSKSST